MKKDIIVVGAGGLGREVLWLIERINAVDQQWNIAGFVDDNPALKQTCIAGYPVLGNVEWLAGYGDSVHIVCAIANAQHRKSIIQRLKENIALKFATLIDPSVICSNQTDIAQGCIICAGAILTVGIVIDPHCIVDVSCTIGHDAHLKAFTTLYPNVNISGFVTTGICSEIGTGTQVIQGLEIGENSIIGAGSVVIRPIEPDCTAVGVPAKIIKRQQDIREQTTEVKEK